MKNFYAVLRIAPSSTVEDIKTAYRELAKKFHPDRGGDPRMFCDIQEAYDVLSDEKLRSSYDERMRRIPFGGRPYRTVTPSLKTGPVDVYDDLVDVLSRRFGFGHRTRLAGDILLSRREAEAGVNLELWDSCERCFGFGGTILSVCSKCRGSGMIEGRRKAYLSIDPGAHHGDVIMSRAGNIEAYFRILIER